MLRGSLRLILAGLVLTIVAGCANSARVETSGEVGPLPLSTLVRFPTTAETTLAYQNACGNPAAVSLQEPLAAALQQRLGRVFQRVTLDPAVPSDGVIDVTVNLKQIELSIPGRTTNSYPVTVRAGVETAFVTKDGSKLWTKKIKSSGIGEVRVEEPSCDVVGLDAVVKEAADIVAEGVAMQVSESRRIREYAQASGRSASRPDLPAVSHAAAPLPSAETPGRPPADTAGAGQTAVLPPSPSSRAGDGAAVLTFRAILRDDNRDYILQPDEPLTIELEVKNDGPAEAKGVEVIIGGSEALTAQLPPVIAIGDVAPGEIKRTTLTKPVISAKEPLRGDVLLSLRSGSPMSKIPPPKRFTVSVKPVNKGEDQAKTDIDQPPPAAPLKLPKAIVIAIGVGQFRDTQVPPMKFAAHDAEVMAAYLQSIGGLSADRVRLLVNSHALKQDLAETFEEWLPRQADASTVVYVYIAGRALVDGVTGAVSLVPYDGSPTSVTRLFGVRRLQESLARLPIQRAILMADVSLEHAPGSDPATGAAPVWEVGSTDASARMMWMIGNSALREAQGYERGRHGLFTYQLLKGLQGPADLDRDGTVAAGELCTFARGEMGRMGDDPFGSGQEALCVPAAGQGATVRIHPMAKGNNPKPDMPAKTEAPAQGEASSAPQAGAGPGQ